MKNQWNKVIIICEDSDDLTIILNDKIHISKLRPQYKLQEQNSIRRAFKFFQHRPFDLNDLNKMI